MMKSINQPSNQSKWLWFC